MNNKSVEEIIAAWKTQATSVENGLADNMIVSIDDVIELIKYFDDLKTFENSI